MIERALCLALLLSSPLAAQAPGRTLWGRNGYIEYIAGNAPIVLAAPHGGYLKPSTVKDRTWGVRSQDRMTQELARELRRAVARRAGRWPHLVICHLHRSKLDANRDIGEAAQGDKTAEQAWREFHAFIDQAKRTVIAQYGRGHFYDVHGHGHPTDWIELGYALSAADLAKSDTQLRNPTFIQKSTIRALASKPKVDFPSVLRGTSSLGGLLQQRGYRCVPSPNDPDPGGKAYFTGGYNTRRHGSQGGGTIDGTQLEHAWNLRRSRRSHATYAVKLAESLDLFFGEWHGISLGSGDRVTVAATSPHASESGWPGVFELTRSGDLSSPRTVALVVEGTATAGVDYAALPASATFAAHAAKARVRVRPVDDQAAEGWESVTVRLADGPAVGGEPSATVLIHDGDGAPRLEAALPLDDVTGNVTRDTTGRGRDANLVPNAATGPRLTAGKHGRALSFDGTDDALNVSRFDYAPGGTFSVAFWFKALRKGTSGYRYVLSHGAWGKPNPVNVYFIESDGRLRTYPVFANAGVDASGVLDVEQDLLDDRWHHYALAVRRGDLTRVWIDGALRAEAMFAGDTFRPAGDLWLGARSDLDSARYFLGELDDVRVYSRAIDAAEARDLASYRPGRRLDVGPGCRGTRGVPAHEIDGSSDIGGVVRFTLSSGPRQAPGLLGIGASKSSWNRIPLPIDFGPFGATGCFLRVSMELSLVIATDATGAFAARVRTPFDPALVGRPIFSQVVAFDAPANGLGLVLSNAQELRLGGIR